MLQNNSSGSKIKFKNGFIEGVISSVENIVAAYILISAPILKCSTKEIQYGRNWTNLGWKKNYVPQVKYALIKL